MEHEAITETEVTNSDPIWRTRPGRESKPCNYADKFPGRTNVQIDSGNVTWIKPCCFDDIDMVDNLSKGTFYHNSCFSEDIVESQHVTGETDVPIERWSERYQHQSNHDSLQWIDFKGGEIEGLCFKTE